MYLFIYKNINQFQYYFNLIKMNKVIFCKPCINLWKLRNLNLISYIFASSLWMFIKGITG